MSSRVGRPEAIVRPKAGSDAFEVERVPATEALAEFVDDHWVVRWRVRRPHHQRVIPQPRVHIAAEDGRLSAHGVTRASFSRTLTGAGRVVGAAFHPGGFRPLLKAKAAVIAGKVRPCAELFEHDDRPIAERVRTTSASAEMVRALEEYLLATRPRPDPLGREVTALVREVERDPRIVRVEQLARHAGSSPRGLQRLFADYLGMGPEWVIQRSRVLDVTAHVHSGRRTDWSALAHRLGFSDQAHLTRVFTRVVGTPPATYLSDPGTR